MVTQPRKVTKASPYLKLVSVSWEVQLIMLDLVNRKSWQRKKGGTKMAGGGAGNVVRVMSPFQKKK